MKLDKIDQSRFTEYELCMIDDGGIEVGFQLKPVLVYSVERHGRSKKCFSRDTAIRHMAFYMTDKVFKRAGILSRIDETYTTLDDGSILHNRGVHTINYITSHSRCMRRIRRLLKKKKQINSLLDKYKKAIGVAADLRKEIAALHY